MSARKADIGLVAVVALGTAFCLAACVTTTSSHGGGPETLEKKKKDAAVANTSLGIAYLRQGDVPLAKEKLDRALQEDPTNPEVHSARAMLYDRMGDPKQADREFKEALSLAPNDPDVSNNYAVYLCQSGRTDEGVRRFEAVAHNALYRTPWIAYTNAGVCLRSAKRDADSIKNFKEALQVRPNFAEAAFQLADSEFQAGNLTDARTQVDTYIGAFEATPDLLLLGVRIARAQNDRMAETVYARKLHLDFPNSSQTQALATLEQNPG